jgi:hypothetical protein
MFKVANSSRGPGESGGLAEFRRCLDAQFAEIFAMVPAEKAAGVKTAPGTTKVSRASVAFRSSR